MSDDFSSRLAQYGGGFSADEFRSAGLDNLAKQVVPDYQGQLYAPIAYQPDSSAITSVNPYGRTGKDAASKLSADVIRAQYADYEKRFQPLENMAIGLIRKDGTADGAYDVARAKQTINSTFDSVQGQQDRSRERFGLQGTGTDISGSTAKASAMVGGINAAKMADQERRTSLLGGGTSAISEAARG